MDTEADIIGKINVNDQERIGEIKIQYANGTIEGAPSYREKDGINYIKSATNLLSLFDVLKVKKSHSNFMKVVNVDEELELQIDKSRITDQNMFHN